MSEWLASLRWPYSSPHPSVSVVCVDDTHKLVNVASVWMLRNMLLVAVGWPLGQRRGHRLGNKTSLWVVSGCDDYSFDEGQVGDVNRECVGSQCYGRWGWHRNLIAVELMLSCSVPGRCVTPVAWPRWLALWLHPGNFLKSFQWWASGLHRFDDRNLKFGRNRFLPEETQPW